MSVTIALAEANNGVHAGVVVTAIKILPGWNFSKSGGSRNNAWAGSYARQYNFPIFLYWGCM